MEIDVHENHDEEEVGHGGKGGTQRLDGRAACVVGRHEATRRRNRASDALQSISQREREAPDGREDTQ